MSSIMTKQTCEHGDFNACAPCLLAQLLYERDALQAYCDSENAVVKAVMEAQAGAAVLREALEKIASWDPPGPDYAATWLSTTCRAALDTGAGEVLLRRLRDAEHDRDCYLDDFKNMIKEFRSEVERLTRELAERQQCAALAEETHARILAELGTSERDLATERTARTRAEGEAAMLEYLHGHLESAKLNRCMDCGALGGVHDEACGLYNVAQAPAAAALLERLARAEEKASVCVEEASAALDANAKTATRMAEMLKVAEADRASLAAECERLRAALRNALPWMGHIAPTNPSADADYWKVRHEVIAACDLPRADGKEGG